MAQAYQLVYCVSKCFVIRVPTFKKNCTAELLTMTPGTNVFPFLSTPRTVSSIACCEELHLKSALEVYYSMLDAWRPLSIIEKATF